MVTARQESPAAQRKARGCGPCRRLQWCCHGLAPLHRVALSHLAHLWGSSHNPLDAGSHMTASKWSLRQIVIHPWMKENHREGEGGEIHSLSGMFLLFTLGADHPWGSRPGPPAPSLCCGHTRGRSTCEQRYLHLSHEDFLEIRRWAGRQWGFMPHLWTIGTSLMPFWPSWNQDWLPMGVGASPRGIQWQSVREGDSSPHRTIQDVITRT